MLFCFFKTKYYLSIFPLRYRFVELYYRRSEQNHARGGVTSARVETVVIFLPDVRSCMPNRLEWETVSGNYKTALQTLLTNKSSVNDADKKTLAIIADNNADSSTSTIPVITISDDNDAAPTVTVSTIEKSSTNININSNNNNSDAITIDEDAVVAVDDIVAVDDKTLEGDNDATADAALVVNPVSSNDKALPKFKFRFSLFILIS